MTISNVGLNPTRAGFLRALERMGAKVEVVDRWMSLGEPGARWWCARRALQPVVVEPDEIPSMVDEVPLLACLASRAEKGWTSVFRGVGELRVKESDRLALVASNLSALGVAAHTEGDTLMVEGSDAPPRGRVVTAGDHRLAMAFAVLRAVPGAEVELDDSRCVADLVSQLLPGLRPCRPLRVGAPSSPSTAPPAAARARPRAPSPTRSASCTWTAARSTGR